MKKIFLSFILSIGLMFLAQAQKQISGKITDDKDGTPLYGVTVSIKGQAKALSQKDGSFVITIPADAKTLKFSYVGYQDAELQLSDNMSVRLTAVASNLNEVVVVGYGRALRKDITGSIAKVLGKDVENFCKKVKIFIGDF